MQSSRGNGVSPNPSEPSGGRAGKRGFPEPFRAVWRERGEPEFPRPPPTGPGAPGAPASHDGDRTARSDHRPEGGGIALWRVRNQTVRSILTVRLEQAVVRCAGGSKKPLPRQGLAGNQRGTTRVASLSRGRPTRRLPVRKPHGDAVRNAQRRCAQLLADVHKTSQKPARRHQKERGSTATAVMTTSVSCSVLRVALCRVPSRNAKPVTKT
jgi:hypothetical protein